MNTTHGTETAEDIIRRAERIVAELDALDSDLAHALRLGGPPMAPDQRTNLADARSALAYASRKVRGALRLARRAR